MKIKLTFLARLTGAVITHREGRVMKLSLGRRMRALLIGVACLAAPVMARADVGFDTDRPTVAGTVSITAFDRAGNGFTVQVPIPLTTGGMQTTAVQKATLIVNTINALNMANPATFP